MDFCTDNLMLRTVSDNDIDEVARMWEYEKGSISLFDAKKAIEYMPSNHKKNKRGYIYHLCFAVFEKGKSKIIGWCGLDGKYTPGETAIFYSIHKDY